MSAQDYRSLIREAVSPVVDADTLDPNDRTLFTPPGHRRALEPDTTIVSGGRGVGKTVWFKSLQIPSLRQTAAEKYNLPRLLDVDPIAGFGAALSNNYPSPRILRRLVDSGVDPEDIWMAVTLFALGAEAFVSLESWDDRVKLVVDSAEAVDSALIEADRQAESLRKVKLILFDAVDRLHRDRVIADRLAQGIMSLGLNLRAETKNIRVKIFIRPDMLDSASMQFTDASKLVANKVELRWELNSLYSLLFHSMCGVGNELSEQFIQSTGWSMNKDGSSSEVQSVMDLIASKHMGTNHRRGLTFNWLPNHLADGMGQVSPRSFLAAITRAAEKSQERFPDHSHALHWDAIREGVRQASAIRVKEVVEDTPWVSKAIYPLSGRQVPVSIEEVFSVWGSADLLEQLRDSGASPDDTNPDAHDMPIPAGPEGRNMNQLVDELIGLGVMTQRNDGRLDLPDVYRIEFGVGRKGGVPLVRRVQ